MSEDARRALAFLNRYGPAIAGAAGILALVQGLLTWKVAAVLVVAAAAWSGWAAWRAMRQAAARGPQGPA